MIINRGLNQVTDYCHGKRRGYGLKPTPNHFLRVAEGMGVYKPRRWWWSLVAASCCCVVLVRLFKYPLILEVTSKVTKCSDSAYHRHADLLTTWLLPVVSLFLWIACLLPGTNAKTRAISETTTTVFNTTNPTSSTSPRPVSVLSRRSASEPIGALHHTRPRPTSTDGRQVL